MIRWRKDEAYPLIVYPTAYRAHTTSYFITFFNKRTLSIWNIIKRSPFLMQLALAAYFNQSIPLDSSSYLTVIRREMNYTMYIIIYICIYTVYNKARWLLLNCQQLPDECLNALPLSGTWSAVVNSHSHATVSRYMHSAMPTWVHYIPRIYNVYNRV